jgi:hypothetical protein
MDRTDQVSALIARNERLMAEAMEARQRAREAAARAERGVQQARQAQFAAERARWMAPPFTMPGDPIKRRSGTPHNHRL